MPQQIINNGETGLVVRDKLNSMFGEIYDVSTFPYPQVANFAALPPAASHTGEIYIVQTTTGIIGFRNLAGLYRSDGASWLYLGLYGRSAVEIANVPAGTIAATNVQDALNELDSDIQAHIGAGGAAHAAVTGGSNGFMVAADKTKLDAITGTNTGDQTSIVGITGTLAEFNTALTGADFATGGGTATGTNTGDQTITLTGNVTGSGTGSFATTIAAGVVTLAMQANMATASVVYRKTAGAGAPEVQTLATLKTDLGLTGTNTGDQTSIVGITGTKAQFDTAVTDGNFLYVGDVTQYTDEMAQDAVGAMVDTSLTYVDGTPLLQRSALTGDVTAAAGGNATTIAADAVTNTKLANMATATFKGRVTAGTGDPEDLTGTQATNLLNNFTDVLKGLAPASGGGTANFLRADGNWATPSGGPGSVTPGRVMALSALGI